MALSITLQAQNVALRAPRQPAQHRRRRAAAPPLAAAARPVTGAPPEAAQLSSEQPLPDGPAPLPPREPLQQAEEATQQELQASTAAQAAPAVAPPPVAQAGSASPSSPDDSWPARLLQLGGVLQQAAVRLGRQLEPPPPGFPPGPPGDAAVSMLQQPLPFLEATRRDYGRIVGLLIGGERVVLVADPAAARAVLIEPPGRLASPPFAKQGTAFFPGTSLTGDGLLTSDGEVWRRQRRLVNPAFRRTAVDKYAEAMLSCTDRMLRSPRWRDGVARDVYSDFNALTLEITLEALFGGGGGADQLAGSEVTGAIQDAFGFFARRGAAALALPEWVPTPDNLGFNAAVARLDRAVYGLIKERRSELAAISQAEQAQGAEPMGPRDLLDALLAAEAEQGGQGGQGEADKLLRDELMTLLIAGQETSAILLGWACAYLAHHPDAQDAAAAEVRALLSPKGGSAGSGGKDSSGGGAGESVSYRNLEAADARRLPLLEAVVLEALRLSPPAYLVGRCAQEDTQLEGYLLQKGTTVLVTPYLLHRDPAVWGPDAAAFRPQRWLDIQRAQQAQQQAAAPQPAAAEQGCPHAAAAAAAAAAASGCPHASSGADASSGSSSSGGGDDVAGGYGMAFLAGLGPNGAYVPFGAGQRNCVGSGFAMSEAILVLAAVLRRFKLKPLPGAGFPAPAPQITLRPAAVRLLLRRRWDE